MYEDSVIIHSLFLGVCFSLFIKILSPTLKKHICVSADTKKKWSILHKFQKLDLDKVVDINFLACSYEVFNSKNYGF